MNDFVDTHAILTMHAGPARPARHRVLRAALRDWWTRLFMDERTAYLSQATSHSDLEHRMRSYDRRQSEVHLWFF